MASDPQPLEDRAPLGIAYQRYWDDEEFKAGLHAEIDAAVAYALTIAVDPRVITEAVMAKVFKRVKLHTWCERPNCRESYCPPTHYVFDIATHPRRFAPEVDDEATLDALASTTRGEALDG